MRGAAGIGLSTTAKYLRRTISTAANNGLSTATKYLVNQKRARVTGQQLGIGPHIHKLGTISADPPPLCRVAAFVVNLEPNTGARPSVRLCVGPELARCLHRLNLIRLIIYKYS
jgi:hypothetical protein